MANNKFGAHIVLEGEAEYRKALKNINSEQRELRSEMKLCSSTYDGQQNSIAALSKKSEILTRQYEVQARKVEIYSAAVRESAVNQEKAGNKVEELRTELETANKKMEEMSESTDASNEALEEQKKIIEELKNKLTLAEESYSRAQVTSNGWQVSLNEAQAGLNDLSHEIQANDRYLSEARSSMDGCADSIDEYGHEVEEAQEKTSTFADVLKAELVGEAIKNGINMVVDGLKNITTTAISMGTSFESSMSNVAATMGITTDEIHSGSKAYQTLENAAKECGKSTKYSASEAADALNYLALAGYDANKAAQTLPKVLNLAAAGGMDLARASDLVTDSMSALGMETSELDNYINEMARAAQKSNTSVAQLGEATLVCAGTVSLTGQSLETMNAELGVLANNGIKSAEGGTHLRNILLSLSAPTDVAAACMKELGLRVFDSTGNMRDLNDIMVDLNASMSGMSSDAKTKYISQIFNKTDIAAVNALLKGTGLEFDNLKKELLNCDGAAKDMAETMGDNLNGKVTILNSALEGLGITGYEKIEGVLKKSVEAATDSVGRLQESMENGRLGDALDDMADALGDAAANAIGFGEDALPVLVDGLTWIIENSDLIIAGISGIVAAEVYHSTVVPMISAVTTAWNAYKAANEGATIAQWAMNAAMDANPAGLLVTAIVGLITAMTAYVAISGTAKTETEKLAESANQMTETLNNNAATRDENRKKQETEIEVIKQLKAELVELNSKEKLSEDQKKRLKLVVDQLNSAMPELNLAIDEQTGHLEQNNEAIEKYISNLIYENEIMARRDQLQQIAKDRLEAQQTLAKLQGEYNTSLEQSKDLQDEYNQLLENSSKPLYAGNEFIRKHGLGALHEVTESIKSQEVLQASMDETSLTISNLENEYNNLSEELEEIIKAENGMIDVTEELDQVMVEYKGTAYSVSSQVADYIAELDAAYAEAYIEAEKSLKGQIGLFDELEVKSDLTVEKMADNMQKQAEIMTTYNEDLKKAMELVSEGQFERGFLEEIRQMGIDGAGYLHEIVKAAETNSADFIDIMEAWRDRTDSIELLANTQADIQTSCNAIKEELINASSVAVDGMEAKLIWGLVGVADKAAKEGEKIGLDTGEGVIRGLSRKMREAAAVAANGMLSVYDAMKKALDIHSPSKKTEYLGEETGEGYIIGTVKTLEEGKEKIHDTLDDLLEHDYKNVTDGQEEVSESIEVLTTAFTNQSSVLADAGNAMLDYMLLGVELDDSVEKTTERVDKLKEIYTESKEEAEESISSQVKLFDKLEMKSDVTLKDMIENLRSQTKYFAEYGFDLVKASELAQQGLLDKGLLGAIQKMGLDGAGYLHELVIAAQNDSTSFSAVMNEWSMMSQTKDNLSAAMAGVEMLYGSKMDTVIELQKVKDKEIEEQTTSTAKNTSATVDNSVKDIVSNTSSSLDDMTEIVTRKSPDVEKAVTELCSVALRSFETSLDIDSQKKSRKFAAIGYSIPQGIAEGIYDGQDLVVNAVKDVIEKSISTIAFEGLSNTIMSKINTELGGLID